MTDNPKFERHFDEASGFVHYDFPPGIHSIHDLSALLDKPGKGTPHQREQETHKLGSTDLPAITIATDNYSSKELPAMPFLTAGGLGGAAGAWTAHSSADLDFLAKQRDFVRHAVNSRIESALDLELGKRLFSQSTNLSYYSDLCAKNREALDKASISLARRPLLAPTLFERVSGSWLGRTQVF